MGDKIAVIELLAIIFIMNYKERRKDDSLRLISLLVLKSKVRR
jgi:hypothetical protein